MNKYAFGNVFSEMPEYTRDEKYENFSRLEKCIDEKCPYLPICGGGCTYHASVQNGGDIESFSKRHCKKILLCDLNEGLLKLSYGS